MKCSTCPAALLFLALAIPDLLPAQSPVTSASSRIDGAFSAVGGRIDASEAPVVQRPSTVSTIEVRANTPDLSTGIEPGIPISGKEILSSAGTFGDVSRYLQVLPGVIGSSDLSNDVLVRGGNPEENLFVIDGVEFPSISHFSLSGSTGGFTSMIDATAVAGMDFKPGVYDASYSSRLSSLIEIHTPELENAPPQRIVSAGISGVGGLYQRKLPQRGSVLLSAHRSILNLFTNDIGIGGVPIYTNGLGRADFNPGSRDSLSFLSLTGADSIHLTPCAGDTFTTSIFQTQYAGWRTTDALTWKHTFSESMLSTLTATYSGVQQSIAQQQQVGYAVMNNASTCAPASTFRTYSENSLIHLPQLKYTVRAEMRGWLVTAGAAGGLIAPGASVAQPAGQLSPFSASSLSSDAGNFRRNFASGQESAFLEVNRALAERWGLMAGVRAEGYALDGRRAFEPRISLLYRLNHRQMLHATWNSSSQLPPTMDLISYRGNRNLPPIEVRQFSAGMRLWQAGWGTLDAEAYTKQYRNEPVSTEYPQLMLFNMVDTLGQSFAWLPLTGSGTAQSRGLEIAFRAHWRSRFNLLTSATRSQSDYRARDGMRRPENYDTPLAVNSMFNVRLPFGIALNGRESLASGRVYCPFDVTDSLVQNRGIYSLARINSVRGPLYNRLDAELERQIKLGKGVVDLNGGAENVLNRGNLLGYVWLGNCALSAHCAAPGTAPVGKLDQIGRFPILSARYQF
jgi:hypothetical protein